MSIERKTRPDSALRNLAEERQAQIVGEWMIKENRSYASIRADLAKDGLKVSENALSRFRTWWILRQQYREKEDTVDAIVELRSKQDPTLTKEQLFEEGQIIFSTLALRDKDLQAWETAQYLEGAKRKGEREEQKLQLQREREQRSAEALKLEREKFEFNAAKAALEKLPQLRKIDGNNSLDETGKIKRAMLELFGELPK